MLMDPIFDSESQKFEKDVGRYRIRFLPSKIAVGLIYLWEYFWRVDAESSFFLFFYKRETRNQDKKLSMGCCYNGCELFLKLKIRWWITYNGIFQFQRKELGEYRVYCMFEMEVENGR